MRNRYMQAYYESFIAATILSWLPVKSLSYLAPFLVLGWFIIRANSGRTLLRSFTLTVVLLFAILLYYLLATLFDTKYLIQNSLLAIVTYGSFFFLLASSGKISLEESQYVRFAKVLSIFIKAEALVGILQFLIAIVVRGGLADNTGDVVQGTIYLLSFWETGDMGMGNQIFTINMSLMMLMYLPYILTYRKGYLSLLLGSTALIVALVAHVIFPLIAAVSIVLVLFRRQIVGRFKVKHVIFATFFGLILLIVYNMQNELARFYIDKFVKIESLKAKVTINSIKGIPADYPYAAVVGLGPGQFCSRAALIATGQYIGGLNNPKSLLFITPAMTPAFEKYIYPDYVEYLTNPTYGFSTMSRPFHSMLAILVEFGLIIFVLLNFMVLVILMSFRRMYLKNLRIGEKLNSNISFACGVALLTIYLISFFENYMELTQAIFPGLILLKVFYQSLKANLFVKQNESIVA